MHSRILFLQIVPTVATSPALSRFLFAFSSALGIVAASRLYELRSVTSLMARGLLSEGVIGS